MLEVYTDVENENREYICIIIQYTIITLSVE
jgi:hypothetical protein